MSLDLGKAVLQLDRGALDLQRTRTARQDRLTALIEQARLVDPPTARGKTAAASRPYLAAQVEEDLLGSVPPPYPPDDWRAISVDGSHIDVDRHLPISCYLVNLGGCVLTYGSHPDAVFFNEPHLATDREEIYLTDEANPIDEEAITGPLLGIIRSIQELERLAEMLEDAPTDLPTLALLDGTLTLWGLAGRVTLVLFATPCSTSVSCPRWKGCGGWPNSGRLSWPPTYRCPAPPRSPTPSAAVCVPTTLGGAAVPQGAGLPGGHLGGPRAGGDQRSEPAAVPADGHRDPGTAGAGQLHVGEGTLQEPPLAVTPVGPELVEGAAIWLIRRFAAAFPGGPPRG